MMKTIVPAAILSLAVVSASWALPVPPSGALAPLNSTDLIQVKKGGGKHHGGKHHGGKHHGGKHHAAKHHGGKHYHRGKSYRYKYSGPWRGYHHGGRYWKHRYIVRPYNWVVLGCVNAGPFWYCP
jgi:hypothetical protein